MQTYKIDNGHVIEVTDKKELEELEKKQYFRVVGAGICVYDFDKHKIRPYVKDYLNRQGTSLEVKYLQLASILLIVTFIFAFYSGFKSSGVATQLKAFTEAQKANTDTMQKLISNSRANGQ